jgi:hypothetical protein
MYINFQESEYLHNYIVHSSYNVQKAKNKFPERLKTLYACVNTAAALATKVIIFQQFLS